MFDFFYGSDSEQYQFYRVPQVLFTDDRFKSISCEAKLLYGFLLDRTSLSKKRLMLMVKPMFSTSRKMHRKV